MKQYKIKILKETPLDAEGNILTLDEWKTRYKYRFTSRISDVELIDWLKLERKTQLDAPSKSNVVGKWFEVIEEKPKFIIGDWVWHEGLKRAFVAMPHTIGKEFRPNYITIEAANSYTDVYKRLATAEEIKEYDLVAFHDSSILIGKYKSYYWNYIWHEIIGIEHNINKYIKRNEAFCKISQLCNGTTNIEQSWDCTLNGLKVGCEVISHDEVIYIAKILNLIP